MTKGTKGPKASALKNNLKKKKGGIFEQSNAAEHSGVCAKQGLWPLKISQAK